MTDSQFKDAEAFMAATDLRLGSYSRRRRRRVIEILDTVFADRHQATGAKPVIDEDLRDAVRQNFAESDELRGAVGSFILVIVLEFFIWKFLEWWWEQRA